MKSFKQKLRKPLMALAAMTTLVGGVVLPAQPSQAAGESLIDRATGFYNTLSETIKSVQETANDFSQRISGMIGSAGEDVQTAINNLKGELGFSDPVKTGEQVAANGEPVTSLSLSTSTGQALTENEVQRQFTLSTVSSALGTQGQEQTKGQLEASQAALKSSQDIAEEVQAVPSTQEVMKGVSEQLREQTKVANLIQAGQTELNRTGQITNLNLANISEALDGEKLKEEQELNASTVRFLNRSGQAGAAF